MNSRVDQVSSTLVDLEL